MKKRKETKKKEEDGRTDGVSSDRRPSNDEERDALPQPYLRDRAAHTHYDRADEGNEAAGKKAVQEGEDADRSGGRAEVHEEEEDAGAKAADGLDEGRTGTVGDEVGDGPVRGKR